MPQMVSDIEKLILYTPMEVSENPETEVSCSADVFIPSLETDKQSTTAPVP